MLVIADSGGCSDGQLEVRSTAHCCECVCVAVHRGPDFLKEQDVLLALFCVLRVLPVYVYAVEAQVFD